MNPYIEKLKRLEAIFITDNPTPIEIEVGKKILAELYEAISFTIPASNTETKQSHESVSQNLPTAETIQAPTSKEVKNHPDQAIASEEAILNPKDTNASSTTTSEKALPETEPTIHIEHNTETISEKLGSNTQPTLYDMIKEIKNNTDLVTYLANQPIKNISKSITLNDKIMFINELFSGDSNQYSEAIEKLNNAANLEEALEILATYHIDTTKDSAGEFIRILYRRFAV